MYIIYIYMIIELNMISAGPRFDPFGSSALTGPGLRTLRSLRSRLWAPARAARAAATALAAECRLEFGGRSECWKAGRSLSIVFVFVNGQGMPRGWASCPNSWGFVEQITKTNNPIPRSYSTPPQWSQWNVGNSRQETMVSF